MWDFKSYPWDHFTFFHSKSTKLAVYLNSRSVWIQPGSCRQVAVCLWSIKTSFPKVRPCSNRSFCAGEKLPRSLFLFGVDCVNREEEKRVPGACPVRARRWWSTQSSPGVTLSHLFPPAVNNVSGYCICRFSVGEVKDLWEDGLVVNRWSSTIVDIFCICCRDG